ncbi:hypothetical protein [Mycoplasma todarodis]|uniref:phosphotriesterase family protein n=1 Tax=Mycoplasma todarodis TaxID=1937191 RepID=UPI003B31AD97
MIQTLNKKIPLKDIKGEYIFAHEHLDFDLRPIRKDETSFVKDEELVLSELSHVKKGELGLIVDVSNQSMDSNKDNLFNLSNKLNIPIVGATGYYLNEYEKNNNKSTSELEKEFTQHILEGVGKNKLKAGIIGEIATSSDKIHSFERKVFTAATRVQKKLNTPIYTHINVGDMAEQHLNLLNELNAIPSKTIIGHGEFVELETIKKILKDGYFLGIDTIGKQSYLSDSIRAEKLIKLIELGFEDQIVLSLDISKQDYLKKLGGHGYAHLINEFYPLVKDKLSDIQWKKITFNNILKVLDI